ncbi:MAG TPA: hypothetical protein VJJ47_00370 [Candidatus Paceibacterota bacterium]
MKVHSATRRAAAARAAQTATSGGAAPPPAPFSPERFIIVDRSGLVVSVCAAGQFSSTRRRLVAERDWDPVPQRREDLEGPDDSGQVEG